MMAILTLANAPLGTGHGAVLMDNGFFGDDGMPAAEDTGKCGSKEVVGVAAVLTLQRGNELGDGRQLTRARRLRRYVETLHETSFLLTILFTTRTFNQEIITSQKILFFLFF